MDEIKTIETTIETIGRQLVKLTSDYFDGEAFDTKVEIEGGTICWVSGAERQNFINDFRALIDKYQI